MSDSPQPDTIDNTETLIPAEPLATTLAEPLASEDPMTDKTAETTVAEPIVAKDPVQDQLAEAKSHDDQEPQISAQPQPTDNALDASQTDPISGHDYTNTSNGNQVAVLSTIDYSTNIVIYNYNLNSIYNTQEYNQSFNSQQEDNSTSSSVNSMSSTQQVSDHSPSPQEEVAARSDRSTQEGEHRQACTKELTEHTNNVNPSTANSLGTESPDDVTGAPGNTSLQRNGFHLRFNSRAYFRSQGARRIDRIMGFNGANSDKLELSRKVFKGIGKLEFESVGSRRQLMREAKTSTDIIYQESNGRLYFNANGDTKGFGNQGGMFAILESTPFLIADHFILI